MTDEASKTRLVREKDFELRYLQGRVIDIGCGPDLIVPHAEAFDLEHGDAQEIGSLRSNAAYDAVCSSHCLEHMRDVPRALAQWWSLVRPGGYLVVVVPDEDLYEQGGWPSLFNSDHKATFRIGGNKSWSPVSYDLLALVKGLEDAEIVSCERHDQGYDHRLRKRHISALDRILFKVGRRIGSQRSFRLLGAPVDQTLGQALAQIQVIARKRGTV
jgi:SAM-dependent methyltransferase